MNVKVPSIGELPLTVSGIDDTFYYLSLQYTCEIRSIFMPIYMGGNRKIK